MLNELEQLKKEMLGEAENGMKKLGYCWDDPVKLGYEDAPNQTQGGQE